MGLPIKIGLGFLIALLGSIIIFGNFVAPKNTVSFEKSVEATPVLPPEPTRYVNPVTSEPRDNLTKNLAGLIGKNIIDLNPEGPLNKKLTVEQAQIIAEKAFTESARNIDPTRFEPTIPLENIMIADNDYYRASLAIILREHTESLKIQKSTDFWENDIDAVLPLYQATRIKLTQLPTPHEYIPTQQIIMSIIEGQINALKALHDYENDPVQGLVALQSFKNIQLKLNALTAQFKS